MRKFHSMIAVFACVFTMAFSAFWGTAMASTNPMDYEGVIHVGGQQYNEPAILTWMAKLLIENHTGLQAEANVNFVASAVVHQAMVSGNIDIYPSWTGTMLTGILHYDGPNLYDPEKSFETVKSAFEKRYNATWLRPFGFNNTYVFAVKRETAEKYGLETCSDLKAVASEWKLGTDENFNVRPDGYPGWSDTYGVDFKEVWPMQYSMMYLAITKDEVDAIVAYSTDSRIGKLNLKMLEDDLYYFPDYHAAYVVRQDILRKYPALKDILELLSGRIDEETMSALNGRHDDGGEAEDIARDFLREQGLI